MFALNPSPAGLDADLLNMIRLYGEHRFSHEHYEALGVLFSNELGSQYIIIAEAIPDQGNLSYLFILLIVVFVCLVAMILAGGWYFAQRTLGSVGVLSDQVKDLAPSDLGRRLAVDSQRKELDGLVNTFNSLLDRIQEAFRVQKLFLANMAHEMRNPLQGIMSDIQQVTDRDCPEEERTRVLKEVLADVRELNDVADKLMILARQESEQSVILFHPFRIDELIWNARTSLVKANPHFQVLFEITSLPESEEMMIVLGNELLIKTALLNLMDNGCKFSPDHQVKVCLGFLPDGQPEIRISDQGPGIAESERSRVFEPFYRSEKTAHIRGSGVGLALVEGILNMHQIQLDYQFADPGSEFILTFSRQEGSFILPE
ncbi:MAG: HAMP domain-containing histidine kinase [Saprospiraceae bacterium]|nr:HAMP domain-containing histidine kinase [Saprospiraceae bacterium]